MASARNDPFDHAVHTAHTWLADVAKELGTGDRRYAYRVLRAWLHTLRDRLTVDVAAKFGAQLPELLRGIYYEGWDPSRVPSKFGPDRYAARFASDARISTADVRQSAAAVTRTLARHMSPGHLAEALAQLPAALRTMVGGTHDGHSPVPAGAGEPQTSPLTAAEELLADLQARVDNLTAAVRALAVGFEETPGAGIDEERRSRAARLAAEILLTAPAPQPPPATSGTSPSSPSSAVVASGSGGSGGSGVPA